MLREEIAINREISRNTITGLVRTANEFSSTILVKTDDFQVNAKSLMSMIALDLHLDMHVCIEATGSDEKQAVEAIKSALI
ncbi:MAG: HPr family phosphocarrier protein [Oscillibacter sp.]|jgi:phosphotransferase system HPr (HPr) family protein|nr:HPr family phosphocarrier protein [Oscillibacter sp.]